MSRKNGDSWLATMIAEDQQHEASWSRAASAAPASADGAARRRAPSGGAGCSTSLMRAPACRARRCPAGAPSGRSAARRGSPRRRSRFASCRECRAAAAPRRRSRAAARPSTVPSTVPTPPLIETPPITTAAMTWNSKPTPVLDGFTKPQRLAYMMPASPESAPEIANTSSVTGVTSIAAQRRRHGVRAERDRSAGRRACAWRTSRSSSATPKADEDDPRDAEDRRGLRHAT